MSTCLCGISILFPPKLYSLNLLVEAHTVNAAAAAATPAAAHTNL